MVNLYYTRLRTITCTSLIHTLSFVPNFIENCSLEIMTALNEDTLCGRKERFHCIMSYITINTFIIIYSPCRAENGPCGYVVIPIELRRTKFIWIINSNLKVSGCTWYWVSVWVAQAQADMIGQFLIAWFNDCIFGKSGQIANPIIAKDDPIPYHSIHAHIYVCELRT